MTADVAASGPGATPASVWERLYLAVDFGGYRPAVRDGIVSREFTSIRGERYVIVQNPAAATYLRLTPEDLYILGLMDGSQTVQQLVVAYMMQFHRIALQGIAQLVEELRDREMLQDRPRYTYQELSQLARKRSIGAGLRGFLGGCLNQQFPISGLDSIAERAYRFVCRPLFTRPGAALTAIVTIAGIPLLVWNLFRTEFFRSPGVPFLAGVALTAVSLLALTMLHEVGHAVAVKSSGRTVRRGGFAIQNGFPGLWVDTQDIWMSPRGARIAVSWAGPYSGFIVAGLAGIILTALPGGSWAPVVRFVGLAALAGNAVQLLPLVRLDGYYILMDWLDIPNLRARSLLFVRNDLWPKILRRQALTHEEAIFAVFGLSALLYGLGMSLLIAWLFWIWAPGAVGSALRIHSLPALLAVVVAIVLIAPFLFGVMLGLVGTGRSLVRAARRARGVARERWYRERANLLAQVPCLARLGHEAMQVLASHAREEWRPAGAAIVRQGDPGDRFYLIVEGRARVFVENGGVSTVVAELGPADYFGERALIERAPRAATVRAESSVRLLSLGAPAFGALLKEYVAADAELRAGIQELAEMDGFELLRPLGPRERQILLRYLRTATFAAGAVIIEQDEPGDTFYLLRSGSVSVSRRDVSGQELELQQLGPGAFFGELALLTESPRVATVRALEESRVWTLGRHEFQSLLGQYFNVGERLMPMARERLMQDGIVAVTADDPLVEELVGLPAPEPRLEPMYGASVSLADCRGRTIVLWFSRDSRTATKEVDSAIRSSIAEGLTVVRIIPDPPEFGVSQMADPGYAVLADPEKRSYRDYGMHVRMATTAASSDNPWSAAMSRLRSEQAGQTDLLEIREGIVLIGSDGLLTRVQPLEGDDELPRILADLAGAPL